MKKVNNFKNVKNRKKTPNKNGNGYELSSKISKCDICAIASERYCRLNPKTCGDNFIRDRHVSLSSGQILDTEPDGRVRKKR